MPTTPTEPRPTRRRDGPKALLWFIAVVLLVGLGGSLAIISASDIAPCMRR